MTVILKLDDLHKTFHPNTPNQIRALAGISLELNEGSFVTIIGTNGSGKSTLLNAVAGSFFVDKGQIILAGQNVTRKNEHRRAHLIGRVFQNPFTGTAPSLTIAQNLTLASCRGQIRGLRLALSRRAQSDIRERLSQLGMGLETRMDTPVGTLSGGQRQALTLFMATWQRPALLLLDEHTAALDPKSAAQVIRLTRKIINEQRLTALMVTHSMQQAVDLGDRTVMVHHGQTLYNFEGKDKQRLRADDLVARFEEVRRTERLDSALIEVFRDSYV